MAKLGTEGTEARTDEMKGPDRIPLDRAVAARFGAKGAIIICLISFTANLVEAGADGLRWVQLTYEQLGEWCPGGERTLRNVVKGLADAGVLRIAKPKSYYRANMYAIDYAALELQAPGSFQWDNEHTSDTAKGDGSSDQKPPFAGGKPANINAAKSPDASGKHARIDAANPARSIKQRNKYEKAEQTLREILGDYHERG